MLDPQILSYAISSFQSFLQSSELNELEQIATGFTTVKGAVKKMGSVREAHFIRKISAFAQKANELGFDAHFYAELERKHGKEKVLEQIIVTIDRLNNIEKSEVLAYLMHALQRNGLNWDEFISLSFALEQLNPYAITSDIRLSRGDDGDLISAATPYFIAVGLASSHTFYKTVTTLGTTETKYSLTPLGNKLRKYGIAPYQNSKTRKES